MPCLVILNEVFRYGGGPWKQSLLELLEPDLYDFLHTHLHGKLGCYSLYCGLISLNLLCVGYMYDS